jgi:hypothetical protein
MDDDHQHVFDVAGAEKPCMEGNLACQIEAVTRCRGDGLVEPERPGMQSQ